MFVFLSKLLPALIYPLNLSVILLLAARFSKSAKRKNRLLTLALLILFIFGNKLPAAWLIRGLETRYPPLTEPVKADAIVVLGGCTEQKAAPRQTVEVNGAGDRLLYGVRLFQQGTAEWMLFGGSYIDWKDGEYIPDSSSPAAEMAELAESMGVPSDAILVQDQSLNTYEEAVADAEILRELGLNRVILVTTAQHMPRSVALFRKQGLEVIPAPTDYNYTDAQWENLFNVSPEGAYQLIIPTPGNMKSFESALKEYIGILVYRLKGWL